MKKYNVLKQCAPHLYRGDFHAAFEYIITIQAYPSDAMELARKYTAFPVLENAE